MRFEFGAVVLVPFPFTDQTAAKRRPAVVVSNENYNGTKPDVVVMALTSQLRPNTALAEIWLADWEKAGVFETVSCQKLFLPRSNSASSFANSEDSSPRTKARSDKQLPRFLADNAKFR